MIEHDPSVDPVFYKDLRFYVNSSEQSGILEQEKINQLESTRDIWKDALASYDQKVMQETGLDKFAISRNQLHNFLAGSGMPPQAWQKMPFDLEGGVYKEFIDKVISNPEHYNDLIDDEEAELLRQISERNAA